MNHRWETIEALFLSAVELPPGELDAFLRAKCGEDHELRQEVESLLEHDRPGEAAWVDSVSQLINDVREDSGLEGVRVGSYRLIREIGAGGMGMVYLAARADDQYQKTVAVKLVRGALDRAANSRFVRERQILATLDHPHIAHLVDGGTADLSSAGWPASPYLVMEYVEGQPIHEYCRERGLSLRQRCELFLKVCEAVSYAHSRMVVHRDLKPSNILVTAEGTPKLLDFGIAKLLSTEDASGSETLAVGARLTPDYASPEQVRGEQVSAGSDVYSLGVVLYELLSGKRAHILNTVTPAELERVICQKDPPLMSKAADNRELAGDLDSIVAMALRKEPDQRYRSVDHLSRDLERYLQGEPVLARKGTWAYRAGKFVRRQYGPLAAVALLILTLLGGIIASRREAREAEHQRLRAEQTAYEAQAARTEAERARQEAEQQRLAAVQQSERADQQRAKALQLFEDVRQLSGKFLFDFHDSVDKLPGSSHARKLVVETGLRYYDGLARESDRRDEKFLRELAEGYLKLANVQRQTVAQAGEAKVDTLEICHKALQTIEPLRTGSVAVLGIKIDGHVCLADVYSDRAQFPAAEAEYQTALRMTTGLTDPQGTIASKAAGIMNQMAILKTRTGPLSESVRWSEQACAAYRALVTKHPDDEKSQHDLQMASHYLTFVYGRSGRLADALALARERYKEQSGWRVHHMDDRRAQRDALIATGDLADILARRGETAEAAPYYRETRTMAERLVALDPQDTGAKRDLVILSIQQAKNLDNLHDSNAAVESARTAIGILDELIAAAPADRNMKTLKADTCQQLSKFLLHSDRTADSLAALEQSRGLYERLAAENPKDRFPRSGLYYVTRQTMAVYVKQKNWPAAVETGNKAVGLIEALHAADPAEHIFQINLGEQFHEMADLYIGMGRTPDAVQAAHRCLAEWDATAQMAPLTTGQRGNRDECAAIAAGK